MNAVNIVCLSLAITGAFSQVAVPPNCVCPKLPTGSSRFPGGLKGPGGDGVPAGPAGRGQLVICTNGPVNFSNFCDLVNTQVANKSLGVRPCPNGVPKPRIGLFLTSGPGGIALPAGAAVRAGVCFTDSHSEATLEGGKAYLNANKGVGILCFGACPCALECPQIIPPPPSD